MPGRILPRSFVNHSRFVLIAVVLTILGSSIFDSDSAFTAEAGGRSIGIFVGVNNFDLKYAAEDAKRQAEIFGGTFNYETAVFSTDVTNDPSKRTWKPTKSNLETQIPNILSTAGPSDTVIVSFSGHGVLDEDGAGYLVPQDASLDFLINGSLSLKWLRDQLRACRADTKLLLLDCCHAGAEKGIGVRVRAAAVGELARRLRDESGLQILASCRASQKSFELPQKGQGLFTHFLIEGLLHGADLPPQDRRITISELESYVSRHVTNYADRQLNVDQTPVRIVDKAGVLQDAIIATWADPKLREVWKFASHAKEAVALKAVAVSADGGIATYVPVFWNGRAKAHAPTVWDLNAGVLTASLQGKAHSGASVIDITRSGNLVASEGSGGVFWWMREDPATAHQLIKTRDFYKISVLGVRFSNDEKLLATTHDSSQLFVWALPSGRQMHVFPGAEFTPRFSSDNREIAAGAPDLEVKIWNLKQAGLPRTLKFDPLVPRFANVRVFRRGNQNVPVAIRALEYSSDDKRLMAVAGVRGMPFHVSVWDPQTTNILHKQRIGRRPTAVAIVPGQQFALLGDTDGTIGLWNITNGQEVFKTEAHSKAVDGIAISADGSTVISGGQDMKVLVFKMAN